MNRRNRSREVAAGWAEVRAKATQDREDALQYRETSIRAGGAWAPQVIGDWREPVYQIRKDLVAPMTEDVRRGQRCEKKLHNVKVVPGGSTSPRDPHELMFAE